MERTVSYILFPALVVTLSVLAINGTTAVRADDANGEHASPTEQTVTFTVDQMTCAACPITVRSAMENVEGVRSVSVDFESKTAVVVFDPVVTTPKEIAEASTNAGYPTSPAL